MLVTIIDQFIDYCKAVNFSFRSHKTLKSRLQELDSFIESTDSNSIQETTYSHLLEFVSDYKNPSIHVRKSRVWALHQFFHFLKLKKIVKSNIALGLPYPKIEKKVPAFLTIEEFNKILSYFSKKSDSVMGRRNLIMVMMIGFLGLRVSSIIALDREDCDVEKGFLWVKEKGGKKRTLIMPQVLCKILQKYLSLFESQGGPLFLTKRNTRISARTLQDLLRKTADQAGINKRLHPHLFRHSAATHLNKVSNIEITQSVLGHARRENTTAYTHLNSDLYAKYMQRHPYMEL